MAEKITTNSSAGITSSDLGIKYLITNNVLWIVGFDDTYTGNTINFTLNFKDIVDELAEAGSSITSIRITRDAFKGCTWLKALVLSSEVTHIESEAFINCLNLESLTFDTDTLPSIGLGCFKGCNKLKTISNLFFSTTDLTHISYLFGGLSVFDYDCIPETLTDITMQTALTVRCFYKCNGLKTVTLAKLDQEQTIPNAAFYGCTQLYKVGILGIYAGQGTLIDGLLDLSGINKVGDEAFFGCNELDTVYIPFAEAPIYFGRDCFKDCFGLVRVYNGTTHSPFPRFIVAGSNDYGCIGFYAKQLIDRPLGIRNTVFRATVKPIGSCLALDDKLLVVHLSDSLYTDNVLSFDRLLLQYVAECRKQHFIDQKAKAEAEQDADFKAAFAGVDQFPTTPLTDPQLSYFESIGINLDTYSTMYPIIRPGLGLNNKADTIILPERCKEIGQYAFKDSAVQTLINLSSDLSYIDANAFSNCINLHTIQTLANTWDKIQFNYPQSIYDNITSIESYSSVTNGKFEAGQLVSKVSIRGIADMTSAENKHIYTWNISTTDKDAIVPLLVNGQFFKKLVLSGTFVEIPQRAFMNCTNLETLEISAPIKIIGKDAFKGCNKLQYETKEKNLPDATCGGVNRIGNFILGCKDDRAINDEFSGYKTLYIDMSVPAHFYDDAFKYCSTIENVVLVGTNALENWFASTFNTAYSNPLYTEPKIDSITGQEINQTRRLYVCDTISSTPTLVDAINFTGSHITAYSGAGLSVTTFTYTTYNNSVEFKHKQVDINAFIGSTIKNVTCLPSMIKAFNNKALTNITIHTLTDDSVIEYSALRDCTTLTTINFEGEQLTQIGFDAFKGCTGIKTINFNGHFCSKDGPTWTLINFENQYSNPMCYCTAKQPTALVLDYYIYRTSEPHYIYECKKANITACTDILMLGDTNGRVSGGNRTPEFELKPYVCLNLYNLGAIRFITALCSVSPLAFAGCYNLTNLCYHWSLLENSSLYWIVRKNGKNGSYIVRKSDGVLVYGTTGTYDIDEYNSNNTIKLGDNIPTAIGPYAFANNSKLYSLEVPEYVKTIGLGAFEGCINLKNLSLPFIGRQSNYDESYGHLGYIFGASHYNSVDILAENNLLPKDLTLTLTGEVNINPHAFYGFKDIISKVYISGNIIRAEGDPFKELNVDQILDSTVSSRGILNAKNGTIKLLYQYTDNTAASVDFTGVQYIYNEAFNNKTNITTLTDLADIRVIGSSAFAGCTGLTGLDLSSNNNVLYLHDYIFKNCNSLSTVILGNNLQSVGKRIFAGCSELRTLTIPNTLLAENTHAEAFAGSTSGDNGIHSLTMPAWLSSYFGDDGKAKLREVTITAGDTIKPAAFSRCAWLRKVTLPSTIKTIGAQAFMNCISLNQFNWEDISDSCISIGSKAFQDCWNLYKVEIPKKCISDSTDIIYSSWTKHPVKTKLESYGNIIDINGSNDLKQHINNVKSGSIGVNAFCFKPKKNATFRFLSNTFCAVIYQFITDTTLQQVDCESYTFIKDQEYLINFMPYAQFIRAEDSNFVPPTADNPNPINLTKAITRNIDLIIQIKNNNIWTNLYSTYEPNDISVDNDYFYSTSLLTRMNNEELIFTAPYYDGENTIDNGFTGFERNESYNEDGMPYNYPNRQVTLKNIAGYEFTKMIGKDAFKNCYKLNCIYADGIDFDPTDFSDCGFDYYEPGTNKNAYQQLYTNFIVKNNTTLIAWLETAPVPETDELQIDMELSEISPYTFANRDALTKVTLSSNITTIGERAFYSCDNLTEVQVDAENCNIAMNAFERCAKLS